jgi:hypothetical protein
MAREPRRRTVEDVHALLVTYGLDGSGPAEHAELCEQVAPSVAAVPGLVSELRLANDATGRYGAFYVFHSKPDFDAFVASELFALLHAHPSLSDVAASDFAVEQ